MIEVGNSKEPVYAEHLPKAKEELNDVIVRIIPAILKEVDRIKQFAHLVQNFDDLSIAVTRDPLTDESVPSLKFGLDENEQKGEKGFKLQFSTDEARKIQTGMDPSLYAALCEEGILRAIANFEKITNENDEFAYAYSEDIKALYALLEEVQTATNPFDIVERINMFPYRY